MRCREDIYAGITLISTCFPPDAHSAEAGAALLVSTIGSFDKSRDAAWSGLLAMHLNLLDSATTATKESMWTLRCVGALMKLILAYSAGNVEDEDDDDVLEAITTDLWQSSAERDLSDGGVGHECIPSDPQAKVFTGAGCDELSMRYLLGKTVESVLQILQVSTREIWDRTRSYVCCGFMRSYKLTPPSLLMLSAETGDGFGPFDPHGMFSCIGAYHLLGCCGVSCPAFKRQHDRYFLLPLGVQERLVRWSLSCLDASTP